MNSVKLWFKKNNTNNSKWDDTYFMSSHCENELHVNFHIDHMYTQYEGYIEVHNDKHAAWGTNYSVLLILPLVHHGCKCSIEHNRRNVALSFVQYNNLSRLPCMEFALFKCSIFTKKDSSLVGNSQYSTLSYLYSREFVMVVYSISLLSIMVYAVLTHDNTFAWPSLELILVSTQKWSSYNDYRRYKYRN